MGKLFNLNGFSTDKTIQEVYSCPLPKHIHMPHHLASTKLTSSLPTSWEPSSVKRKSLGKKPEDFAPYSYRPQTKFAKVMFLHLSVSHSVQGGVLPQCMMGYTPQQQTPPWQQTPPQEADTPWEADTPSPGSRHPPAADTPPGRRHPPRAVHAWRYGQQAGGTHPTGMHTCIFLKPSYFLFDLFLEIDERFLLFLEKKSCCGSTNKTSQSTMCIKLGLIFKHLIGVSLATERK